jgi:hypothetical protein
VLLAPGTKADDPRERRQTRHQCNGRFVNPSVSDSDGVAGDAFEHFMREIV